MYRPHSFRVPIHLLLFRLGSGSVAGRCVEVAGGPAGLANIPLVEVGHLRGESARATPCWVQHRGQGGAHGSPHGRVAKGSRRRRWRLAMNLHVLPQGARVSVRLVTASDLAVVGLVAGVDMGVFLSVTAVGKLPVAAIKFTFERLFPCNKTWGRLTIALPRSLIPKREILEQKWGCIFPFSRRPTPSLIPTFQDATGKEYFREGVLTAGLEALFGLDLWDARCQPCGTMRARDRMTRTWSKM